MTRGQQQQQQSRTANFSAQGRRCELLKNTHCEDQSSYMKRCLVNSEG